MTKFAIIENGKISNLIIGDNLEAIKLLLPHFDEIVEVATDQKPIQIGLRYLNGKFESLRVHNQWVWNEAKFEWESPIPYPKDGKNYFWNELDANWQELILEPSEDSQTPTEPAPE